MVAVCPPAGPVQGALPVLGNGDDNGQRRRHGRGTATARGTGRGPAGPEATSSTIPAAPVQRADCVVDAHGWAPPPLRPTITGHPTRVDPAIAPRAGTARPRFTTAGAEPCSCGPTGAMQGGLYSASFDVTRRTTHGDRPDGDRAGDVRPSRLWARRDELAVRGQPRVEHLSPTCDFPGRMVAEVTSERRGATSAGEVPARAGVRPRQPVRTTTTGSWSLVASSVSDAIEVIQSNVSYELSSSIRCSTDASRTRPGAYRDQRVARWPSRTR